MAGGGGVAPPTNAPPTNGPTGAPTPAPTGGVTAAPPTKRPDGCNEDMKRTVVFIKLQTSPGEDMFVRGGINHNQRPGDLFLLL